MIFAMLIGGISSYSKVVNSFENLQCFKLEFFSKIFVGIKVSTYWWNLYYNAKGGKYHSPEKQPFPSGISHYNLWDCFLPPFGSHSEMMRRAVLNVLFFFVTL